MSFYLKSEKPVEILQHGVLHAGSLALPEDETEQYSEDSGHTLHIVIRLGGAVTVSSARPTTSCHSSSRSVSQKVHPGRG